MKQVLNLYKYHVDKKLVPLLVTDLMAVNLNWDIKKYEPR